MKQILLMIAVVASQSVLAADKKPLIADPIVEKAVREELEKPEGELTKADLAKVTVVYFNGTKITDAGLKELPKLQQLERLSLRGTKITDACLKDIAKLQQLERLYLGSPNITDAGLKELAKLQQLEWLHLSRTQITDASLKDLAKLQKLTFLSLLDAKITDAGVAELRKALPKCDIRHSYKKD